MPALDIHEAPGARAALREMLTMRAFDTRVGELFEDGALPGFVHLYLGQEAVGVGACGALEPDDYIASTHRGHGHSIAKGLDMDRMMAELFGRDAGYCGGKGGSMHIAAVGAGMLGANGIVAAGVPIATGAALAASSLDRSTVSLAFFGEGGVAQGQAHEAINLAATWDLPAVYLIENNHYSEATPVEDEYNVEDLSRIAASYGIPGETVDGQDVEAVFDVVSEAVERARSGDGPTVIEAKTYRYRGHFEGDSEPYRDGEEVRRWQEERDPIDLYEDRLLEDGVVTAEEVEQWRTEIRDAVDDAVAFAEDADDPDVEVAYADVFDEPAPEVARFRAQLSNDCTTSDPLDPTPPEELDGETERLSIREAINETLARHLREDPSTMLVGENIGTFGGSFNVTTGLLDEFGPERVRDTPISEAGFVGASVGAAMTGLRPIVEVSFSDFLGVPFEQLFNQASKTRYMLDGQVDVPLTIRTMEGGGLNGAAQHSKTPHTFFSHLTGLKVAAPSTPSDAKGLLTTAIRSDDPVLFFENKTIYDEKGPVPTDDEFAVPLGRAAVRREGTDVTLVATQRLLHEGLDVAADLEGDASVEVIDPRTLYPLDTDTIAASVRKTGRLVVADESALSYGTHAEIVTRVVENAFFDLDAPVRRVGVPDTPLPYSPSLEDDVVPDASTIRTAIESTL